MVLVDLLTPALSEILFLALSATQGSQLGQIIALSVVLGLMELTKHAWNYIAEAHSVNAQAKKTMVFLYSFSTRIYVSIAFL